MRILIISLLILIAGCKQDSAKAPLKNVTMAKKGQLLFFINPNGRPCQMQQQILNSFQDKFLSKVEMKIISTTDPTSRSYFYQYGVRALPAIIILDRKGETAKRFAPGIKSETEIMSVISNCGC